MENKLKRKLDICLSPDLIKNFEIDNTSIVIIDIVRASSTICTAFHYGIEELIPVAEVEEAIAYKKQGYITAGERNGDKLEGFDFGNSPISIMTPDLKGKKLAITTTNGTKTISMVAKRLANAIDSEIIIGAFVNYQILFQYLRSSPKNILLVCSGWKGNVSIEDTLFAGKLSGDLNRYGQFEYESDAPKHAELIFDLAKDDLFGFIMDQSKRFKDKIGDLGTDIRYCLKENVTKSLPFWMNGKFIDKSKVQ